MTDPILLRTASPERLAAVLGPGVPAAVVARLVQSPRLQTRLTALMVSRLGELGPVTPSQAKALALMPDALVALSRRAGAVWHAGALARTIDGPGRRSLAAAIGEDDYGTALAGLFLAPPAEVLHHPSVDLIGMIATDGAACLAAWCGKQPATVAGRLNLSRPDAQAGAAHDRFGPKSVAWLLER